MRLACLSNGVVDSPLLPAPRGDAPTFCKRGITSQESSQFLRMLVGEAEPPRGKTGDPSDVCQPVVSSHSLKATCLSWAAKHGLDPASRSILGRHSCALNSAQAMYARDLAIGPTRQLASIIQDIAVGKFQPDAARSEYFVPFPPQPPAEVPLPAVEPKAEVQEVDCGAQGLVAEEMETLDVLSSDESSSTSGDAASSSDPDRESHPPVKVRRFRPRIPVEEI